MEVPLTVAAVAFLGAYAWPILDPDLSLSIGTTCVVVGWTVWVLFAVDLVARVGAGRFVGVVLMVGGIALLGTVTATFASWLIEAVRDEAQETETQLDAVQADLTALRERLDRVLVEHGEPST